MHPGSGVSSVGATPAGEPAEPGPPPPPGAKKGKYEETCRSLGRAFLPLGLSVFGALSEGTTELLSRVADAAHQQGYVGEVWVTLKGDRVRAMHGLFRGLSHALNNCEAIRVVCAQAGCSRPLRPAGPISHVVGVVARRAGPTPAQTTFHQHPAARAAPRSH